jgi:F-box-like
MSTSTTVRTERDLTVTTVKVSEIKTAIQQLEHDISQVETKIGREHDRMQATLRAAHAKWIPLIQDAQSRLPGQMAVEDMKELEELEKAEQLDIRRGTRVMVEELNQRRAMLEKSLLEQRALLAPVGVLPFELLGTIFEAYVASGNSPWNLTSISRQFRAVALRSPCLWNRITVTDSIQDELGRYVDGREVCNSVARLEAALGRAQNTLLDVSLRSNLASSMLSEDDTVQLFEKALARLPHIRSLHISSTDRALPRIPPCCISDDSNFTLRDIKLEFGHTAFGERTVWAFIDLLKLIGSTSNGLEYLCLGVNDVDIIAPYFSRPTLRHLVIQCEWYSLPGAGVLGLLRSCDSLWHLSLKAISLHGIGASVISTPLLRTLHLEHCTFGNFLDTSEFPFLEELSLKCNVSEVFPALNLPNLRRLVLFTNDFRFAKHFRMSQLEILVLEPIYQPNPSFLHSGMLEYFVECTDGALLTTRVLVLRGTNRMRGRWSALLEAVDHLQALEELRLEAPDTSRVGGFKELIDQLGMDLNGRLPCRSLDGFAYTLGAQDDEADTLCDALTTMAHNRNIAQFPLQFVTMIDQLGERTRVV